MLFVLARSHHDFEVWRLKAGLPTKVVHPIVTAKAVRGRRLSYRDVVRLDGFALNPQADLIAMALLPCGIQLSRVAAVSAL